MNTKILGTIKFRLIAWFALLLVISSLSTLLLINYSLQATYNSQPPTTIAYPINTYDKVQFIQYVQQDRDQTRDNLLIASLLAIAAQIVIASVGSYIVIKRMLSPLEELNELIKDINDKRLTTFISSEDNGEEINSLITSFNQMIERLNKAFVGQKQFVQNVSHEVKTPLTIIKTNLESILFDKTISEEELHSSINTSIKSIDFLNTMVEDLLLLSFIDSQKIELEKIEINNTVPEVVAELKEVISAHKSKVEIETQIDHIQILANPTLFKRAIFNLVENAIKYSPGKSVISIRLSVLDRLVRIEISDQGEGIAPEHHEKIFERFFRIDKSRSRETGGSGLGLAITKEIVTIFKGTIKVESLEKGTKFVIEFPEA